MERVVIGNAELWHGDCREVLPHVSADACVTDPPYGIGYVHSGGASVSATGATTACPSTVTTSLSIPSSYSASPPC